MPRTPRGRPRVGPISHCTPAVARRARRRAPRSALSLACALAACALAALACTSDEVFQGRYVEVYEAGQVFESDTVVTLDLFQFGNEVGGVVRFHSTQVAEAFGLDPSQDEARRCYWAGPVRLQENQRSFTLTFPDEFGTVNILRIEGNEDGSVLAGRLSIFGNDPSNPVPDPEDVARGLTRSNAPRSGLSFELDTTQGVSSDCLNPPAEVELLPLQLVVDPGLRELSCRERNPTLCPLTCPDDEESGEPTFCDPRTGVCRASEVCAQLGLACVDEGGICDPLTSSREFGVQCISEETPGALMASVVWINRSRNAQADWSLPVAQFQGGCTGVVGRARVDRRYAPGRWDELALPFDNVGTNVEVALGVALVYRELDTFDLNDRDARPRWNTSAEPLVGTPFRLEERGGREFKVGRVLLYIEGDLAGLSEAFLDYFPDEAGPREGYGVYEIVVDPGLGSITSISYVPDTTITMTLRDSADFFSPDDPERLLPVLERF